MKAFAIFKYFTLVVLLNFCCGNQPISVEKITYTVTYDGNDNTSGSVPSPQTKTEGIALTLSRNTGNLVRTGHTFTGWNTESDGSGTAYEEGASYTADAGVTL